MSTRSSNPRPYGDTASRGDRVACRCGSPARHVAAATRLLGRLWPFLAAVRRTDEVTALAHAGRSTEELVRAGWHTGPVPYGYRPQHILISPHGQRPRHRVRLVVEPAEAFVVWTIFTWRVHDNFTCGQITDKLTGARYPAPLYLVTEQPGTWTVASVRSVLRNPKYAGWQVWGRHHHGRRLQRADWVWSDTQSHPTLIPTELYDAAQRPRRATIELTAGEATPRGSGHRIQRRTS